MIIDILATIIILSATTISIAGAYYVSGTSNTERKRGFKLWQASNILWICTFLMGVFGLITPIVFLIQQSLAGITFLIYFISNYRGEQNNGTKPG